MNNFDFIKIMAELSKQGVDANRYMSEEERSYRKAGIDLTKELAKQYFESHKQIVSVVAALIWDNDRFLICQRPANKSRGLLWEFVGGKVEAGETKEQALVRECREELNIILDVGPIFMEVVHEYPDITVHLTLFNACGDDWSIREISPSEGYLLDSASYHVGAEACLYTAEYNSTSLSVTEKVIKGNIAIIKHTDSGETQLETPEVGTEFEVYLKSAGRYNAAKESERDSGPTYWGPFVCPMTRSKPPLVRKSPATFSFYRSGMPFPARNRPGYT